MIRYRTGPVGAHVIFYREAGDPKHPTLLLLHGFPSSSHMFRNLIPLVSDRFHIVAVSALELKNVPPGLVRNRLMESGL